MAARARKAKPQLSPHQHVARRARKRQGPKPKATRPRKQRR